MLTTVKVTWDPNWPSKDEAGAMQYLLLLELANDVIPRAVAEALSIAHKEIVPIDSIMVYGEPFENMGFGLPNIWIDIQGAEVNGTHADRSRFRSLIAELVQWRVSAFYGKFRDLIKPPMYDVEYRTIASSGRSINQSGDVVMAWG